MCVPSNASNRSRKLQSWTPEEWDVFFSVMSRDSPEFFSSRIIWRESDTRFYLCYVTEIDRFVGRGTLVWDGLHITSLIEYATDEEDMITYGVEEEKLEPDPTDKFTIKEDPLNFPKGYLRSLTPSRYRKSRG
ncbi:hypothetical protein TNCV_2684131 [Trichonephila clavipes]|nr:hypothetical protein TNCV_2684131 [Trichonephila clavipes]